MKLYMHLEIKNILVYFLATPWFEIKAKKNSRVRSKTFFIPSSVTKYILINYFIKQKHFKICHKKAKQERKTKNFGGKKFD